MKNFSIVFCARRWNFNRRKILADEIKTDKVKNMNMKKKRKKEKKKEKEKKRK